MARSEAEIDLIVNATDTLPEIQRDLDRIVRVAENGADEIDLDVALDTQDALRSVAADLDRVIASASNGADDIDLDAVLDQRATLNGLQVALADVISSAQSGVNRDPIQLDAVLNGARTLAGVRNDLDRVVAAAQASADDIDIDVDVDTDNATRSLRRFLPELDGVTRSALTAGGALGRVGLGVGAAGAAVGTAVPLLAGLVAALESVLPASALATQGMLSMALVSGTLKLGMLGVGEAIEAAFDPEATPQELAEAMDKLAPSAQDFVTQLRSMKDEFKDVQLDVQDRLFRDLDDSVSALGRSALPQVSDALGKTADSLNRMARGAVGAAVELAADGTLGKALDGATKGIENLADVPAQAVTAFGQLAAAAAPAFDRVTLAVARVATEVATKLDKAFESGALEDAINDAIDVIAQLGRIAGNVFGVIGNLFAGLDDSGETLFGTLEKITQALEDATGTEEFQRAIGELAKTMGALATAVVPLFVTALESVAEVVTILGPPARELIRVLGDALGQVLDSAQEPLAALATAFGELVVAVGPLITLAGELIAAILPSLTPLFENLGLIIQELAPVIEQLALNIAAQLVPILERLPEILEIVLPLFVEMAELVLPLLADVLEELRPSLEQMAVALGDLFVELAPLISDFIRLAVAIAEDVMPVLGPIFIGVVRLAADILSLLAQVIGGIVIPILDGLVSLLKGDVEGALDSFGDAADVAKGLVIRAFGIIRSEVGDILSGLANSVSTKAAEIGVNLLNGVKTGISNTIREAATLPGRILGALGNLNGLLVAAGQAIINGLISGITSKIGSLISTLGTLTSLIRENKGPIEKDRTLLTPAGQVIMDGLIAGFDSKIPEIKSALGDITAIIPQSVGVPRGGSMAAPAIFVSIGNEAVDQYVTVRTERIMDDRERTMAQGVRR